MTWTYETARHVWSKARKPWRGRPRERGTLLKASKEGGDDLVFTLEYHRTPLVRWFKDGRIAVNTHGWTTRTTYNRIYTYTGVAVRKVGAVVCYQMIGDAAVRLGSAAVEDGTWKVMQPSTEKPGRYDWLDSQGQPIMGPLMKVSNRPRSAKRDPFSKMCRGDVFLNSEGKPYIYAELNVPMLVAYYGDVEPGIVRMDLQDHIEVDPIFTLTMQAGGWTLGTRTKGE